MRQHGSDLLCCVWLRQLRLRVMSSGQAFPRIASDHALHFGFFRGDVAGAMVWCIRELLRYAHAYCGASRLCFVLDGPRVSCQVW